MSDQTTYFKLNLPEDDDTNWGNLVRDNWNIMDVTLQSIKNVMKNPHKDLQLHREGGDHDSLYYKKTELDANQLGSRYYTKTDLLTTGILDSRYYKTSQIYTRDNQLTKTEIDSMFILLSSIVPSQYDVYFYTQSEMTDLGGITPTSLLAIKSQFDALVSDITTQRVNLQAELNTSISLINNDPQSIKFTQVFSGGKLKLYYSKNSTVIGYSMAVDFKVVLGSNVYTYPTFYIPYCFDKKGLIANARLVILPRPYDLTGWTFESEVKASKQFQFMNFGLDDTVLSLGGTTSTAPTTQIGEAVMTPFAGKATYYIFHPTYFTSYLDATRGVDSYGNSLGANLNLLSIKPVLYGQIRKPYNFIEGAYDFYRNYYYAYTFAGSSNTATPNSLLKTDYIGNMKRQIPVGYNYTSSNLNYYIEDVSTNKKAYYVNDVLVDEAHNVFYITTNYYVRQFDLSTGNLIKTILDTSGSGYKLFGATLMHPYLYIMSQWWKSGFGGEQFKGNFFYVMNVGSGTSAAYRVWNSAINYPFDGIAKCRKIMRYGNNFYVTRSTVTGGGQTQYVIDVYMSGTVSALSESFEVPEGQGNKPVYESYTVVDVYNVQSFVDSTMNPHGDPAAGIWNGNFKII